MSNQYLLWLGSLTGIGAVHKLRHTSFGQFCPPVTLCHTSRDHSPKVRHTSRTPPFLVGLVQKSWTKVPCTNYISIVRKGSQIVRKGVRGFCPGWFFSVPPSITIHLFQQKVKHHFKFHVSYV